MDQAILKNGFVVNETTPTPIVAKNGVLIKVVNSCISAGTEMTGIQSTDKTLIKKAIEQPERILKAFQIFRDENIFKGIKTIQNKLDRGQTIGYSISGIVIGLGKGVNDFKIGDHVAAGGVGYAHHAAVVDVPKNLVVKIPDEVSFQDASTVALGSIAMQAIRRSDLKIGELAVVYGAGLLGLLCLQTLKSMSISVVVIDIDKKRLKIAEELGADFILNGNDEHIINSVISWSGGYGVDAVLFTAATTLDEPLSNSFQMCRRKGRVVLVGVSGMHIKRQDIYAKEIDLLISTSYGPGRYDVNYEEKGIDYPYAYVRWTENRNMQCYLQLLAKNRIKLDSLIEGEFDIDNVKQAYEKLKTEMSKPLILLLKYSSVQDEISVSKLKMNISKKKSGDSKTKLNVGIVGIGSFATNMHLPNLITLKEKYRIHAIMDLDGYKAKKMAKEFEAQYATSSIEDIIEDPEIDLMMICTRHDSHAEYCLKGLLADKHVFVEKPLATTEEDLKKIVSLYKNNHPRPIIFVGFNRRFSKLAIEIKKAIGQRINPLFIHYRMNAGYIPLDFWVHNNGGRIVGEACHIIDLFTFLTDSKIRSISIESLSPHTNYYSPDDNKAIMLKYHDGSICTLEYFAVGNHHFPKEYMEVHFDGKTIIMDDYKTVIGYGVDIIPFKEQESDKGHLEELNALYHCIHNGNQNWPIDFDSLIETTKATFLINAEKS